jgi:CheY-like chemotaxis protein
MQSAKSQTQLIDDILDTSRIITGRLKLDFHPVEIERVFQAAVDVIRPSAEAKRIAFHVSVDYHGAVVFGDGSRLQQVIWNLLSNAVKFTNEGGRVEAKLTRIDRQIQISVSDTRIGIDSPFLPYVFDRFRQADSTSTRRYGGLGLGLAIVRHVVEMHGGTVSVASPGKGLGSTFKIRFPLASTVLPIEPEAQPPEAKVEEPATSRVPECQTLDDVRVLVVEDDPDTLEMLRFVLDDCGASVATAASSREALDVFEKWHPDVLVSDIAMPEQDSYELIGKVRSRTPERGGNTPAVALTAYARTEDRARALAAGFQLHVAKPVDPETLVTAVASLSGRLRNN